MNVVAGIIEIGLELDVAQFFSKRPLGRFLLVGFNGGDAPVKGEGLLDLLKALDYGFDADAVYFLNCVETLVLGIRTLVLGIQALVDGGKDPTNFPQFRSEKILNHLSSFINDAHENISPVVKFTPFGCI
jgi:hypothetical protein